LAFLGLKAERKLDGQYIYRGGGGWLEKIMNARRRRNEKSGREKKLGKD
jgi:hypothetical protein